MPQHTVRLTVGDSVWVGITVSVGLAVLVGMKVIVLWEGMPFIH